MKYIATFINKYSYRNFALQELQSICEMLHIKLSFGNDFKYNIETDPYIEISFDEINNKEICDAIVQRSILVKNIMKVYSEGETTDDLINNLDLNDFQKEIDSTETMKFEFDSRNITFSKEQQTEVFKKWGKFDFKGKINLSKSERTFVIFDNFINNTSHKIFGLEIAAKGKKRFYTKYDLINRKYLGPTSTDHILTFLMCNLAQVQQYDCVIDPFAGTGSLLIPPTHYGAHVFGSDLDIRVLKGYSVGYVKSDDGKGSIKKEGNIFTNFDLYNLPRPQILRQDINHTSMKIHSNFFDAIICDPPYGFRACSKQSGLSSTKKEKRGKRIDKKMKQIQKEKEEKEKEKNENTITSNVQEDEDDEEEDFNPHMVIREGEKVLFTPWQQCNVSQIFEHLLSFGEKSLKYDGRLVCLFPTKKLKSEIDLVHLPINFPQNPSFKLIHACENKYSSKNSRWCLVYKKINY